MDKIKVAKVSNTILQRSPENAVTGTLHITPHHLLFIQDSDKEETWVIRKTNATFRDVERVGEPFNLACLLTGLIFFTSFLDSKLSYALIHSVERRAATTRPISPHQKTHAANGDPYGTSASCREWFPVIVRSRNFLFLVFLLPSESDAADVFDSMQKLGCSAVNEQLLAFSYKPFPPFKSLDGWTVYDPEKEYTRMGVGTKTDAWRLSSVNKDYTLCSTYPAVFPVPTKISDVVLNYAAKFRSKGRIPALSYLHRANMASITRCSQPMVGIKKARSIQDEKLIEAIFATNAPSGGSYGSTTANLIVDARPTANAMANVAKGAGTESMENYKGCKKVYLGIDNIHVMRESLARLADAAEAGNKAGSLNRSQLMKSGWLKHIKNLLEGAALIVKHIHIYSSHVLVHCSDGWDRTSQLVSLAELCLDPFYRTIRGLQVLIEKDWVSFGHKFGDRQGHISGERVFLMNLNQNLAGETAERVEELHAAQSPPASNNAFSTASAAAGAFADAFQLRLGGVRSAAAGSLGNLGVSVGSAVNGGPGTITHGKAKETSPVFHQFLNAIYQIWRQYPTRFEYDEKLLIELHTHSYACQFGTFLFNTEQERFEAKAATLTSSVWDHINSNVDDYRNPIFLVDEDFGEDAGVLIPESTDLRFWTGIFGKKDSGDYFNDSPTPSSSLPAPSASNKSQPSITTSPVTSPTPIVGNNMVDLSSMSLDHASEAERLPDATMDRAAFLITSFDNSKTATNERQFDVSNIHSAMNTTISDYPPHDKLAANPADDLLAHSFSTKPKSPLIPPTSHAQLPPSVSPKTSKSLASENLEEEEQMIRDLPHPLYVTDSDS